MSVEFYVVMQKRQDGKVYADLHKSWTTFFLDEAEAQAAMEVLPAPVYRHVVKLIACTEEEYSRLSAPDRNSPFFPIEKAPRDGTFFALYLRERSQPVVVNWPRGPYFPGVWHRSDGVTRWSGAAAWGCVGDKDLLFAGWRPLSEFTGGA